MAEPVDRRESEVLELRSALHARILAGQPDLGDVTANEVWRGIKRALSSAYDEGFLDTPPAEIHAYVPKPRVVQDCRVEIHGGLVDGSKPRDRTQEQARLRRPDGAFVHFTLTLECATKGKHKGSKVERLWAYDFELVFPDGHGPRFVRFDLNEPGHTNEEREIRSHLHPGNDDLLVPAPVMSPVELIDVLVARLHGRDDEKPRH